MKPYDYRRAEAELAEGRLAIIARYRGLVTAAANTPSRSLSEQYAKSARQLRARHDLTDEEIA